MYEERAEPFTADAWDCPIAEHTYWDDYQEGE